MRWTWRSSGSVPICRIVPNFLDALFQAVCRLAHTANACTGALLPASTLKLRPGIRVLASGRRFVSPTSRFPDPSPELLDAAEEKNNAGYPESRPREERWERQENHQRAVVQHSVQQLVDRLQSLLIRRHDVQVLAICLITQRVTREFTGFHDFRLRTSMLTDRRKRWYIESLMRLRASAVPPD